MKRSTKRRISTVVGVTLGAVTLTGPLAGSILADWQCDRGLCDHGWHRHLYKPSRKERT